jgi:hypothetical protein
MDVHQPGIASHYRLFRRLSCRALQGFMNPFTLLSIMPGFFMGFPLFARSSTASTAGGVQINSGAA